MASDLITIASSGLNAARAGLNATAQNISNAATAGYIRRSVDQTELAQPGNSGVVGDMSLSGVVITGLTRNADAFLQAEARRTGSDSTRADALVTALGNVSSAVEQSNVYSSITSFQAALQQLSSDPTSTSLRANTLVSAQNMAQSFNLASRSLGQVASGLQLDAGNGVSQVNQIGQSLAQLNLKISSDPDPATNQATLLDQRDSLLSQLSGYADITATLAGNGTVSVNMGGASGPQLVSGGTSATLASTTAANGTLSFTLGGSALTITGGTLAADAQGLTASANATSQLDTIAANLATTANAVQTGGIALNGSAGQALFSGNTAATLGVALTSGSQLATAPAGAGAGSQDITNLTALQNALTSGGVADNTNNLIFSLSSAVQSNTTTRDALDAIASNAKTALSAQTGVSLDDEAANLLRYQQAFQASGKVIQVAQTLFNQLLQIS